MRGEGRDARGGDARGGNARGGNTRGGDARGGDARVGNGRGWDARRREGGVARVTKRKFVSKFLECLTIRNFH